MGFTDSHGNDITLPDGASVAWRVSGYAIIQRDDALLMVQSGNGLWIFPGGGVEEDETISEAVVRECLEETGYGVTLVDSQPFHLREQKFYHTREQSFYHSIQLFYTATLSTDSPDSTKITDHDKLRRVSWISLADLTVDNTHPTIAEVIKKLRS